MTTLSTETLATLDRLAQIAAATLADDAWDEMELHRRLHHATHDPREWGEYDGSARDLREAGLDPNLCQSEYHLRVGLALIKIAKARLGEP
jgi:hypothetical protein